MLLAYRRGRWVGLRSWSAVPNRHRAGLLLFALCASLVCTLTACRDAAFERFYPSLDDAKRNGEINRGFIPDYLPKSARNIHEFYDMSPATEWCAFEFLPVEADTLRSSLRSVDVLPSEVKRVVNPGKPWWPGVLAGSLDIEKIQRAGLELSIQIVPDTHVSNAIFLFAVDRTKGRGFFYSVHQHLPECFPKCGK
jgi:hypothetical protein